MNGYAQQQPLGIMGAQKPPDELSCCFDGEAFTGIDEQCAGVLANEPVRRVPVSNAELGGALG